MSNEKDGKPKRKEKAAPVDLQPDVFEMPAVHQAMHPMHRMKKPSEELKEKEKREDK